MRAARCLRPGAHPRAGGGAALLPPGGADRGAGPRLTGGRAEAAAGAGEDPPGELCETFRHCDSCDCGASVDWLGCSDRRDMFIFMLLCSFLNYCWVTPRILSCNMNEMPQVLHANQAFSSSSGFGGLPIGGVWCHLC